MASLVVDYLLCGSGCGVCAGRGCVGVLGRLGRCGDGCVDPAGSGVGCIGCGVGLGGRVGRLRGRRVGRLHSRRRVCGGLLRLVHDLVHVADEALELQDVGLHALQCALRGLLGGDTSALAGLAHLDGDAHGHGVEDLDARRAQSLHGDVQLACLLYLLPRDLDGVGRVVDSRRVLGAAGEGDGLAQVVGPLRIERDLHEVDADVACRYLRVVLGVDEALLDLELDDVLLCHSPSFRISRHKAGSRTLLALSLATMGSAPSSAFPSA